MAPERDNKAPLIIKMTIDESLRIRILELGISPAHVAKAALKAEVKRVEEKRLLRAVQQEDPRITVGELRSNSARIKHLKSAASVREPSVEI
jgi:hypothetical protein